MDRKTVENEEVHIKGLTIHSVERESRDWKQRWFEGLECFMQFFSSCIHGRELTNLVFVNQEPQLLRAHSHTSSSFLCFRQFKPQRSAFLGNKKSTKESKSTSEMCTNHQLWSLKKSEPQISRVHKSSSFGPKEQKQTWEKCFPTTNVGVGEREREKERERERERERKRKRERERKCWMGVGAHATTEGVEMSVYNACNQVDPRRSA